MTDILKTAKAGDIAVLRCGGREGMKALSINQPWAWLIVNGYKAVENRSWDTRYRGEFLIHAGKKFDDDCYLFLENNDLDIDLPLDLPMGGIVGKARLVNTIHIRDRKYVCQKDSPWFVGEYGFMLDSAEPLPFMPCKGALGFFTPDYNSRYVERAQKPKKQQPATTSPQGVLI